MPYAPELGFSADGFQSDSCCQSASRQENCAGPICASANDRASSTLGVGGGGGGVGAGASVGAGVVVGTGASCVDDVAPRPAPSERETVVARSPTVSSAVSPAELAPGSLVLACADVDATMASERGVAGATTIRTATMTASAAVHTDVIALSNGVPFQGCVTME